MEHYINITLAQIEASVGDIKNNAKKILEVWKAVDDRSHLVVFPELSLSGYPPEDLLLRLDFLEECKRQLEFIVSASKNFKSVGIIGTPFYDGDLYNSAVVIKDGSLLCVYHKHFLAFDQKRYFKRGKESVILELKGTRIGLSICEDIWYPDGLAGVEVLVNINASPYYMGKYAYKEAFLKARAEDNLCYVVYVNMVGGQDELVFDGRSLVIDPDGFVYARAKAFQEDTLTVSLELKKVRRKRLLDIRLREIKAHQSVSLYPVEVSQDCPFCSPRVEKNPEGEEEIYTALKTGLRAYFTKNHFEKAVIGLSGGIDSSLTACLAVDALGKDKVVGVFMPSEFTSQESKEDAFELAKNLGIELYTFPIDSIFMEFRRVLKVEDFSIADENLQARIRANFLLYLSNKYRWLVLATSNKSEASVGYTTIYGDMAGGFAPLKDVYKTLVYRLASYRNSIKQDIPQRVFEKPPSAELRHGQTDQDTLPPYELLDTILMLYIEEGLSQEEIVKRGIDPQTVKKVINMVRLAEYKRKQSPVGVKITQRAFGRDWRMPITNLWRG